MQKKILFWLRILVSVGAAGYVVFSFHDRFDEVASLLGRVKWPLALSALLLFLFSQALITARLKDILAAQDVRMSYGYLFYLTMIALFFNNFLPSAIGGDVIKAYYAGKHSKKTVEPYTAIFTDRVVGFVTMILWSLVAVFVYRQELSNPAVFHSVGMMSTVALLLILFFFSRRIARPYHWIVARLPSVRWRENLERLYDSVNGYRYHRRLMLLAMLISSAAQFLMIFMNWILAQSMGLSVSIGTLMLLLPIIAVVQNAPSINGMGVRESAYVFFLGEYMTDEGALALAILFYLIYLSASLVGGALYAIKGDGISVKGIRQAEAL